MSRVVSLVLFSFLVTGVSLAQGTDLTEAVIVVRAETTSNAERAAADVLVEEFEKRTGVRLAVSTEWPSTGPVIALAGGEPPEEWPHADGYGAEVPAEGYFFHSGSFNEPVWILGADGRGALYGVGHFLRNLYWQGDKVHLRPSSPLTTSPEYPIRGHQLGFRYRANSWDFWTLDQFDQYIRELTFFGVNSIENIPFQDERISPLMKLSRDEANVGMSQICEKYGLDYWIWSPAEFHLTDKEKRAELLAKHEALFEAAPVMTGVFFPGGDPGENPPELVLPYLEDMAKVLNKHHPEGKVWLSLQWFNDAQQEEVVQYIKDESPEWLGGLVAGPSSPPIPETRNRLPKKYKYRLYPDITHNKLCQYPVPWWDQAFAMTLGREAINPRPVQYAAIHNRFAPYSDGFISYSDGVHDDVNKVIWSARSWNPEASVHDILAEYSRAFFGTNATMGIMALERNWQGPIVDNPGIHGTLELWKELDERNPQLRDNWRWHMNLLRAYYDMFVQHKVHFESEAEREVLDELRMASEVGSKMAMARAEGKLTSGRFGSDSSSAEPIIELCDALFESIQLQTSVEKHSASGAERGAFLDFIDRPLNNAWWLEDELEKVRAMDSEKEKIARLLLIANWETPGRGSYYDDIGNVAKSPRVVKGVSNALERHAGPTHWWMDDGMSRARLSHQTSMDWPEAVVYEGVDAGAEYVIRTTGVGQGLLRIDGERVKPYLDGRELGEFKEFRVPADALADRKLVVTWDRPTDEAHLNWREQSRVCEIWLLKQ